MEGKTSYFLARNQFKISKQLFKNKDKPIIVSFDRFDYQILVTQAVPQL